MLVRYRSIDGELVSEQWYVLLTDLRRSGVYFVVREGHRTMARQWYFYNLYRSGRGNLAAFPSPFAPHIRTGRFDHAIDFGNAQGVINAAAKMGVTITRTVRGEEWHLEANASQLKAYWKKHRPSPQPTLKRSSKGRAVVRLKKLMRAKGLQNFNPGPWFGKGTEDAIKRFQKRHGMKADGIVGPRTWNELRKKR